MNELLKIIKELPDDQLDKLIKSASEIRSKRPNPIDIEFPTANVTKPVVDPIYRVNLDRFSGRTLICLRHPGFGWIHYIFPAKERDVLIDMLSKHRRNVVKR